MKNRKVVDDPIVSLKEQLRLLVYRQFPKINWPLGCFAGNILLPAEK